MGLMIRNVIQWAVFCSVEISHMTQDGVCAGAAGGVDTAAAETFSAQLCYTLNAYNLTYRIP